MVREDCIVVAKEAFQKGCLGVPMNPQRLFQSILCAQTRPTTAEHMCTLGNQTSYGLHGGKQLVLDLLLLFLLLISL